MTAFPVSLGVITSKQYLIRQARILIRDNLEEMECLDSCLTTPLPIQNRAAFDALFHFYMNDSVIVPPDTNNV